MHPYTQALLDVVPEAEGIDRPILSGEPPDPTRIPPGCRFHPRCPLVMSGATVELGIEAQCTGVDPVLQPVDGAAPASVHAAACHAVRVGASLG
jgi:peptide/nickel transport system ATP-binding protein